MSFAAAIVNLNNFKHVKNHKNRFQLPEKWVFDDGIYVIDERKPKDIEFYQCYFKKPSKIDLEYKNQLLSSLKTKSFSNLKIVN